MYKRHFTALVFFASLSVSLIHYIGEQTATRAYSPTQVPTSPQSIALATERRINEYTESRTSRGTEKDPPRNIPEKAGLTTLQREMMVLDPSSATYLSRQGRHS